MRRFFRTMTILSALPLSSYCGCCSGLVSPAMASDKTRNCCYVLEIKGMTCESCAAHVQEALRQVPGVAQAKINFRGAQAEIHPKQGARLTADALTKAVEQAGYRAKVVQRPQS